MFYRKIKCDYRKNSSSCRQKKNYATHIWDLFSQKTTHQTKNSLCQLSSYTYAAKFRVTQKGMIKAWLHRAGMATPPHPRKHTAASTQTHKPSATGLDLQIAHTCFWLLAVCHPPPALTLFPQHRKPSRQASGEGLVRQPEHGSAGPVWTEPVKFTLGNSGLQKQHRWPSQCCLRQSTPSNSV